MDLAGALGLGDRELVSVVGAGGKKTAMKRLVDEAEARGLAATFTTTTHTPPPADLPLELVGPDRLRATVAGREGSVAVARDEVAHPERADRKLAGFDDETVADLFASLDDSWVVVKADGARRREFKAPGEDEPVIPAASTHVVPVVSVRAVGEPLAESVVHRPDRVAALTDLDPGDAITPDAVGAVLADPEGGLKRIPDHATVTPLVNKADSPRLVETADSVLEAAFGRTERFERGLLSSFEEDTLAVRTAGPG